DRHWGRGAATDHFVVALCYDRRRPAGGDPAGRGARVRRGSRAFGVARALRVRSAEGRRWRPSRRRYRSSRVRIETAKSLGAAQGRARSDRRQGVGPGPTPQRRTRVTTGVGISRAINREQGRTLEPIGYFVDRLRVPLLGGRPARWRPRSERDED